MNADDLKRLEELKKLRWSLELASEYVENARAILSNCVSYASTELREIEARLARFERDMGE